MNEIQKRANKTIEKEVSLAFRGHFQYQEMSNEDYMRLIQKLSPDSVPEINNLIGEYRSKLYALPKPKRWKAILSDFKKRLKEVLEEIN